MSNAALRWAGPLPVRGPAKSVLNTLADHANDAGTCFPSIERICLFSGFRERAVRLALRQLEDAKLITVSRVPGMISVYALSLNTVYTPASDAAPLATTPARDAAPPRHVVPPPRHEMPETPARDAPEPSLTPKEPPREPSSTSVNLAFEEFWNRYPIQVGKGGARKAWLAACKKVTGNEILAGLANAKFPADPQYISHPANWLKQERWSDVITTDTRAAFRNGFVALAAKMAAQPPTVDESTTPLLRLVENGK